MDLVLLERPYQKHIAQKESHVLCKYIYELTTKFPRMRDTAL